MKEVYITPRKRKHDDSKYPCLVTGCGSDKASNNGPDGHFTLCKSCSGKYRCGTLQLYQLPDGRVTVQKTANANRIEAYGFPCNKSERNMCFPTVLSMTEVQDSHVFVPGKQTTEQEAKDKSRSDAGRTLSRTEKRGVLHKLGPNIEPKDSHQQVEAPGAQISAEEELQVAQDVERQGQDEICLRRDSRTARKDSRAALPSARRAMQNVANNLTQELNDVIVVSDQESVELTYDDRGETDTPARITLDEPPRSAAPPVAVKQEQQPYGSFSRAPSLAGASTTPSSFVTRTVKPEPSMYSMDGRRVRNKRMFRATVSYNGIIKDMEMRLDVSFDALFLQLYRKFGCRDFVVTYRDEEGLRVTLTEDGLEDFYAEARRAVTHSMRIVLRSRESNRRGGTVITL